MVSGIKVAGDGAFESGHGCLQHRQSGVSGGTFNAGEGILAGLEAFAEVAKQQWITFLHLVQNDSGAC